MEPTCTALNLIMVVSLGRHFDLSYRSSKSTGVTLNITSGTVPFIMHQHEQLQSLGTPELSVSIKGLVCSVLVTKQTKTIDVASQF